MADDFEVECWVLTEAFAPYAIKEATPAWFALWELDEMTIGQPISVLSDQPQSDLDVSALMAKFNQDTFAKVHCTKTRRNGNTVGYDLELTMSERGILHSSSSIAVGPASVVAKRGGPNIGTRALKDQAAARVASRKEASKQEASPDIEQAREALSTEAKNEDETMAVAPTPARLRKTSLSATSMSSFATSAPSFSHQISRKRSNYASRSPTGGPGWAGRLAGGALAMVAGYVGGNMSLRFGVLPGPMSGNSVRLGLYTEQGEWELAVRMACLLSGFFAGGMITLIALDVGREVHTSIAVLVPTLLLPAALVSCDGLERAFAFELSPSPMRYVRYVSLLAGFTMGGQNIVTGRAPCLAANTTFMTGTVKRITEGVWALARRRLHGKDLANFKLLVCLWLCYAAGGVLGAAASSLSMQWQLSIAAPIQSLTLFLLLRFNPEPVHKQHKIPVATPTCSAHSSREPSPVVSPAAGRFIKSKTPPGFRLTPGLIAGDGEGEGLSLPQYASSERSEDANSRHASH
jgi:uncharacterized membrane protein YoaK (UPF0700 family)